MGSIITALTSIPLDTDPGQDAQLASVYSDLAARGFPIPALAADVISRDQLEDHLQLVIGQAIKTEVQADPFRRGYAGKNNVEIAGLLNNAFFPKLNGTARSYNITLPLHGQSLTALVTSGLGAPGFLLLGSLSGMQIRFFDDSATVALRGERKTIASSNDILLTLESPLSVPFPSLTDKFEIVQPDQAPPRISAILNRVPFSPNAVTEADVASALS